MIKVTLSDKINATTYTCDSVTVHPSCTELCGDITITDKKGSHKYQDTRYTRGYKVPHKIEVMP